MFDKDIIINENPEPLEWQNADDSPFEDEPVFIVHVNCWNCEASYTHSKIEDLPSSECPKCKALN